MKKRFSSAAMLALVGALGVAIGSFALALPRAVSIWHVSPDTIEILGIAYNWVQGRGWVDPILYSSYLPGALPPIHGLVMRPPAISLAMAPAIALGASLPNLQLVQSALASLIAGAAVLVAGRSVSLPAAVAFGIALSWSPSWLAYSSQVLSEPLAIGALLLLVAGVPSAARSPVGAARLGLLAAIAWLTRPNLAVVLLALGAAIALQRERRALWPNAAIALVVFGAIAGALDLVVRAATGFGLFSHYGLLLQSTHAFESAAFQRSWPGFLPYLAQNADRVLSTLAAGSSAWFSSWFLQPSLLFVGWLALPACVYALRRRAARFESRVVALSGLALLLVVLTFYGGPDPERLSLPAAACFWLLAVEMLDALALQLRGRVRWVRAPRAMLAGLPLFVVLAVFSVSLLMTGWLPESISRWESYRARGPLPPGGAYPEIPRSVCDRVEKDALVAAAHPWNLYLWCGNTALWLPPDLSSQEVLQRYLDARKPTYIVSNPGRAWPPQLRRAELEALLRASPRLEKLSQGAGLAVYRVRHAVPPAPRWQAPPPLAAMGK